MILPLVKPLPEAGNRDDDRYAGSYAPKCVIRRDPGSEIMDQRREADAKISVSRRFGMTARISTVSLIMPTYWVTLKWIEEHSSKWTTH
jgi:hypothetical protein